MKTRLLVALLPLVVAGCSSLNPVRYASIPFEYGANADISIERTLRHKGVYYLYVLFDKADGSRWPQGGWPAPLPGPLHVLVMTNDAPVLDRELQTLWFNGVYEESARYAVASFLNQTKGTTVKCRVTDMSDSKVRIRGTLVLERAPRVWVW